MITNPQAIKFANEVVRPTANAVFEAFMQASAMLAEFKARPELAEAYGLVDDAIDPEIGAQVLNDQATVDGRPIITGADVLWFVQGITEILEDWNVSNPQKLRQVLRIKTRE